MNKKMINKLFITIFVLTSFLIVSTSASACVNALDCDDSNPCTDDSCNAGICEYTNNTAVCDDGNACTTSDTCSAGACEGGAAPNCDDGNVCTDDSCDTVTGCVNTAIVHTVSLSPDPLNLGSPGEQGVITALVEESSVAVAGEAVSVVETADPSSVTDLYHMAELDINGEAVVTIHGLVAGTGTLVVTAVDGNGDEILGVNYTLGTPLDSGCATISGSVLTIGGIAPCDTEMTVTCDDGVDPTVGYLIATIEPASTAVTVEVTPVTDSDGEALLLVVTSAAGQATVSGSVNCGSGEAIVNVAGCEDEADCDDGNVCTDDACESGSCNNTPVADGTGCDDGAYCTDGDTCDGAGTCQPGAGDPCTLPEVCNESTDSCDSEEVCGNGTLEGTEVCDDGNTNDGDCCSATCTFEEDGSTCEDGAYCTDGDTCDGAGTCQPGTGDPCAADEICIEESDSCESDESAIRIEGTFSSGCGMPFLAWFGIVQIRGFETDFDSMNVVSYNSPLVLKLPKRLNPTGDTITQVVFLLPSLFFPALGYPATVTVTVDELSDTIDIPSCIQ